MLTRPWKTIKYVRGKAQFQNNKQINLFQKSVAKTNRVQSSFILETVTKECPVPDDSGSMGSILDVLGVISSTQAKGPAQSDTSVTIVIRNHCPNLQLQFHEYALKRGCCPLPPPPVISPRTKATFVFRNAHFSPLGTSGRVAYTVRRISAPPASDDQLQSKRLVLRWSLSKWKHHTHLGLVPNKSDDDGQLVDGESPTATNVEWFQRQHPGQRLQIKDQFGDSSVAIVGIITNAARDIWTVDLVPTDADGAPLAVCQELL